MCFSLKDTLQFSPNLCGEMNSDGTKKMLSHLRTDFTKPLLCRWIINKKLRMVNWATFWIKNFCVYWRKFSLWIDFSLIVIVLVHGPVSRPGLWPSGSLGHDDLVNPENGAGGVGGVLECPVLQEEKVVDLFIGGVDGQAACGDVRVVLKKYLF